MPGDHIFVIGAISLGSDAVNFVWSGSRVDHCQEYRDLINGTAPDSYSHDQARSLVKA
jgi:hypothetical protein